MEMDGLKSIDDERYFGDETNFWRYNKRGGFDLTRQKNHSMISTNIYLNTTTYPVVIDPTRSALIIIDMQNFFLHPSIRTHQTGLSACSQLLQHAIPAARKAKIQIIWLNWGLTEEDIALAPPGLQCVFAFDRIDESTLNSDKKPRKLYKGFGTDMGEVILPSGEKIDAGRLLMRHSWNTQLYDPLQQNYSESLNTDKPDQWFHKVIHLHSPID
jgi:nicotinamidase-related amidase